MKIDLDSSERCLVPCRHCGSVWGEMRDGTGPHAKRIDCHGCGRFLNWMGLGTAIRFGMYERDEGAL